MILFVDDNKAAIENIIFELELEDMKVDSLCSVDEFIAVAKSEKIDKYNTLVMDYNLEDRLNGIELFEYFKEIKNNVFEKMNLFLFTGNLNYLSSMEKAFLKNFNIEGICKNNTSTLIKKMIK